MIALHCSAKASCLHSRLQAAVPKLSKRLDLGFWFGLGLDNVPLLLITAIWIFLSLICLTPTTFVRLTVANEKTVVAGGKQSIKINDENN